MGIINNPNTPSGTSVSTQDWTVENLTVTGDLVGATGRGLTLKVAASDATDLEKNQADYVADGTSDDVEIQAAIDALDANTVGSVELTAGRFYIANTITGRDYMMLQGQHGALGYAGTWLEWSGSAGGTMLDFTDKTQYALRDFTAEGIVTTGADTFLTTGATLEANRSRFLIEHVKAYNFNGLVIDAGVGLTGRSDDCLLLNVHLSGGTIGIDGYRDHFKMIGGGIYSMTTCALQARYMAGFWSFGVLFSGNSSHVIINSNDYVNPHVFDSAWFEITDTDGSIVKRSGVPSVSNVVYPMTFRDCRLGIESVSPIYAFELTDIKTTLTIQGGYTTLGAGASAAVNAPVAGTSIVFIGHTGSENYTFTGNGEYRCFDPPGTYAALVTSNSGTATVANGQTTVTVTHGLTATPTRVQVTPTLLSNAASFWITAKGATTFVINVNADPGVGTATFDWHAQVGEG